jgi:hypothetical protein
VCLPPLGINGHSNRKRIESSGSQAKGARDAASSEEVREAADVHCGYQGQRFCWSPDKATGNFKKHGIHFEQACEVFFDPFVTLLDATPEDEAREAALGLTEDWTLLFAVHVVRERSVIRIISARRATAAERRLYENNG